MPAESTQHPDEERDPQVHFVFEDGEMAFSLPPVSVSEVTGFSQPTPVPFTPDWIAGVISVRGQIVPVMDLGMFFGLGGSRPAQGRRVLVIDDSDYQFAVWADRIRGVETIPPDELEQPLDSIPGELLACSACQFRLDDQLVIALDPKLLVERTRAQVRRS